MKEMDMAKIIEQAADLSKIFNQAQDNNEKENKEAENNEQGQEDGFARMAAMMEIMQLMRSMQQEPEKQPSGKHEAQYYDDSVLTPTIRSIKSAIPYLEHRYQRPLGITIKLIEIQRLLEMYNRKICTMQDGKGKDWQRGMVEAIRPNIPEAEQYRLEMLLKLMDVKELYEKIHSIRKRENKWQSI